MWLHIINLGLAIFGIVAWIAWAIKYPRQRYLAIVAVSWLLHVAAFYAVRILLPGYSTEFNAWSDAIQLQALILTTAAAYVIKGSREDTSWIQRHS